MCSVPADISSPRLQYHSRALDEQFRYAERDILATTVRASFLLVSMLYYHSLNLFLALYVFLLYKSNTLIFA